VAGLNASGPRFRSAGFTTGISTWTYLLNQGPIVSTYLARVVWPHPLVADYGRTGAIDLAAAAPSLAVVAAALAFSVWLWRRDPRLGYLGAWFFVTLAPASSFVPIATEVGAERRMYLPLAALVVLTVLGVGYVLRRKTRLAIGLCAAAVLACAGVSFARNADYHDRLRLWQTVVEARPHGRAHHNLAIELAARQRRDEAIAHYQTAAASDAPEAHYALGYMFAEAGRPGEAAVEFRRFLQRLPDDALAPKASNMLGLVLAQQGDHAGAVSAFRETLRMRPRDADALGGLADALRSSGRLEEAEGAYRAYLEMAPGNAVAYGNLGIVLSAQAKAEDAAAAFERAVELAPQSADARLNYAVSLMQLGRTTEAVAELQRASQLAPHDPRVLAALQEAGKR
jgi:tetratricopeptide (TPR) repeat protein